MNSHDRQVILDALDSMHLLTDWEADFINSLAEIPTGKPLSERQAVKLQQIADKIYDDEQPEA